LSRRKSDSHKYCVVFTVFLVTLVLSACNGTPYSFMLFSYPPNTRPHDDGWQYLAKVAVFSEKQGALTNRTKKNIHISIIDRKKRVYLTHTLQVVSANVGSTFRWDRFEEMHVDLLEVGNEFADDAYNRMLLKSGPNVLARLTFTYDASLEQFKIVNEGTRP
jgi:hypothetical protein